MAIISIVLPGYSAHAVGGYKVIYQYANSLVDFGHSVNILQMRPDHLRLRSPSHMRRILRSFLYRAGSRARPRWFSLDARVTMRNFNSQSVGFFPNSDVLVATSMETAEIVSAAAQDQKIPGVYFIQHYETWSGESTYVDATWRLPLHKIVIAPWLVDKASEFGETAVLVPNAIDPDSFPPGEPIGKRPLQVLALVSDLPWKRTDLVSKAFTAVARQLPSVKLKTFGVVPRPESLPTGVVHVQSPSPAALRQLYQESRIYLCASDSEGWHLPPAEAMSSGSAVVSTNNHGVRAYADGVALFSEIGDSEALAANLLKLLNDPDLCQRLASDGQNRINSRSSAVASADFERELLNVMSRP